MLIGFQESEFLLRTVNRFNLLTLQRRLMDANSQDHSSWVSEQLRDIPSLLTRLSPIAPSHPAPGWHGDTSSSHSAGQAGQRSPEENGVHLRAPGRAACSPGGWVGQRALHPGGAGRWGRQGLPTQGLTFQIGAILSGDVTFRKSLIFSWVFLFLEHFWFIKTKSRNWIPEVSHLCLSDWKLRKVFFSHNKSSVALASLPSVLAPCPG